MVARRGDFTRAIELTREIDKLSKTSPMGALLRARIYAAQGKTARPGSSLQGSPRAQLPASSSCECFSAKPSSSWETPIEALRQANMVLDVEKNRADAQLLQARALAETGTTPTEKDQQQREAIARLESVTKANPHFEEAFHTLAEIHFKRRQ